MESLTGVEETTRDGHENSLGVDVVADDGGMFRHVMDENTQDGMSIDNTNTYVRAYGSTEEEKQEGLFVHQGHESQHEEGDLLDRMAMMDQSDFTLFETNQYNDIAGISESTSIIQAGIDVDIHDEEDSDIEEDESKDDDADRHFVVDDNGMPLRSVSIDTQGDQQGRDGINERQQEQRIQINARPNTPRQRTLTEFGITSVFASKRRRVSASCKSKNKEEESNRAQKVARHWVCLDGAVSERTHIQLLNTVLSLTPHVSAVLLRADSQVINVGNVRKRLSTHRYFNFNKEVEGDTNYFRQNYQGNFVGQRAISRNGTIVLTNELDEENNIANTENDAIVPAVPQQQRNKKLSKTKTRNKNTATSILNLEKQALESPPSKGFWAYYFPIEEVDEVWRAVLSAHVIGNHISQTPFGPLVEIRVCATRAKHEPLPFNRAREHAEDGHALFGCLIVPCTDKNEEELFRIGKAIVSVLRLTAAIYYHPGISMDSVRSNEDVSNNPTSILFGMKTRYSVTNAEDHCIASTFRMLRRCRNMNSKTPVTTKETNLRMLGQRRREIAAATEHSGRSGGGGAQTSVRVGGTTSEISASAVRDANYRVNVSNKVDYTLFRLQGVRWVPVVQAE